MIYPRKPENAFSIPEASQMLPLTQRQVYRHVKKGRIPYLQYQNGKIVYKALWIDTINWIKSQIIPPAGSVTIGKYATVNHLGEKTIRKFIDQRKIDAVLPHQKDKLSPSSSYYRINDLLPLHQIQYEKHRIKYRINRKIKTIKLPINTMTMYDGSNHYSISDLGTLLNPETPISEMIIHQWIIYHRINTYNVDLNGKLYFTAAQAQAIKHRYKNIPRDAYITNKDLAAQIGVHPSTISNFRQYYHIDRIKVLGYVNIFYTKANADKIADWYRNRNHRPYPYYPNQKKRLRQTGD